LVNNPEEFVVMTVFGALALILLYPVLGISMKMVGHNLATFYVYIWARTFEGSDVNFMDFFTLKAEMMPWFFCLQTFLLEQEVPLADLIGIVVGHIYYYLRNKGLLTVPAVVQEWFRQPRIRKAYAPFQEALE
jgi:Derlin-2/3